MTVIYDIFLKGMKRKKKWILGKQIKRNLKAAQICSIPTVFGTFLDHLMLPSLKDRSSFQDDRKFNNASVLIQLQKNIINNILV